MFFQLHFMSDTANNRKSILGIEWTNQHGCGGNELGDPHKLNCEIVIQYMCTSEDNAFDFTRDDCTKECFVPTDANPTCANTNAPPCATVDMNATGCFLAGYIWADAQFFDQNNCPHRCDGNPANANSTAQCAGAWVRHTGGTGPWPRFRDGLNTNRQEYTEPNANQLTPQNDQDRKNGDVTLERALHESWEYYDQCYRRERNRGEFCCLLSLLMMLVLMLMISRYLSSSCCFLLFPCLH
jgi:hypothetical protein